MCNFPLKLQLYAICVTMSCHPRSPPHFTCTPPQDHYTQLSHQEAVESLSDVGSAVACLLQRPLQLILGSSRSDSGDGAGDDSEGQGQGQGTAQGQGQGQGRSVGEGCQVGGSRQAQGQGRGQVVLLLDGLDEGGSGRAGGNELLMLLREHLAALPSIRWVLCHVASAACKCATTRVQVPRDLGCP